ncbi:hypothetical protein ABH922_002048 [Rhodococcus sp. 27YEA15]|uniref:hypothetical protein n=1 Tax=Rhodococcus sp. 27YEA15 TaxID=3156259 RepID=UPI003C7ADDBA
MSSPSATLTVWAASWLAGDTAPDDVIDALAEWAPMHLLGAADQQTAERHELDWPGVTASGVSALLRILRTENTDIRLVLPTAGDVRGLPVGTDFARAAISAGEGVQIGTTGEPGMGLVPVVEGPDVMRWTLYPIPAVAAHPGQCSLREAEYALRQAVREAADALGSLQTVATGTRGSDARALIAEAMQAQARHRWPAALSPRHLQVLDTADNVAAILDVAAAAATHRPPTAAAEYSREELLRRLWDVVRAARIASADSMSIRA